jgi:alpha-tubulin suppressor-like RCC1 family protein
VTRLPALLGVLLLAACNTTVLDLGGDRESSGSGGEGGQSDGPLPVDQSEDRLATGGNSTCFRRTDGVVKCWGQNDQGQLAVQTEFSCGQVDCTSVPVTAPALEGTRQIVLGARFGCARGQGDDEQQPVSCWGDNSFGQLGRGTSDQDLHLEPLTVGVDAAHLVAGSHHACAIAGERVLCWGLADDGQLGIDPAELARCPVPDTLRGVAGVPDADDAACAREPLEVPAFAGATDLALGDAHTCAVLAGGQLICAGQNAFGQLGSDDTVAGFEPVEVLAGDVGVVAAGARHTCAVQGQRTRCWGDDASGQLGIGSVEHQTCGDGEPCLRAPAPLPDLPEASDLQLGGRFSCALLLEGEVRCWGDDSSGQLGNSSFDEDTCETSAEGSFDCLKRPLHEAYDLSGVVELRTGGKHACALLESDEVRCWGSSEAGQTSSHQDVTFGMMVYGLN